MNKAKTRILAVIFSAVLMLCACGQLPGADPAHASPAPGGRTALEETPGTREIPPGAVLSSSDESPMTADRFSEDAGESENRQGLSQGIPQLPVPAFSLAEIEPYTGQPYAIVNGNLPYFSEEDLTAQSFEFYSDMDDLGRCGTASASIGTDLMPTEERGNIGQVKPSGWHLIKYDIVDGRYLYNRCHLIGYQLTGENTNEKNLITGTRCLNVEGMLPFENMVADYVKETENHVLYRVTPVFEGNNLLASGVLMEAESVEDNGNGILFCVYIYNVQPGIIIDYATGESSLAPKTPEEAETTTPPQSPAAETNMPPQPPEDAVVPDPPAEAGSQNRIYILNTNTKKFHYPSCSSVDQMKESNKKESSESREDIISQGYDPCRRCNP